MSWYIDPGTGSMLFTIILGLAGGAFYFLKKLIVKLKFIINGGKRESINKTKLPLVVFTDDKRYWNVFKPVCDEIGERGQDITYLTCSSNDPALEYDKPYFHAEFIGEGNRAFAKMNYLNAGVVISSTPSLDVFQWKRSKDVDYYIHIQHAANDISGYRMFGVDYFDAIFLSGEYQVEEIRKLEELRNLPEKDLEIIGIPYMDVMAERLRNAESIEKSERTVLLAPSWGPNSILNRFGEAAIQALIDTGYHIILRPHPQSYKSEAELLEKLKAKFPETDQLEWNKDNDNFDVLRRSDILISDFSGVIFDFTLVYDKPVIYANTNFDRSPYDYWWIEEEPWTFAVLPKIGMKLDEESFPRLKEMIDTCIEDPKYAEQREIARSETWMYRGEGVKRAADYIMNKVEQLRENSKEIEHVD